MVVEFNERVKEYIRSSFEDLERNVILKVFISKDKKRCLYFNEALELASKVASLSRMVSLKVFDVDEDKSASSKYSVELAPTILIHCEEEEYGVRFIGIPAEYEFKVFIDDIVDVSRGTVDLDPQTRALVQSIKSKARVMVFVTPSCPYCPLAVRTAHKFAVLNKHIIADAVESYEFSELAERYNVLTVPKIVINESVEFEGAVPERYFI